MIIDTHCHYNSEPLLSEVDKHWQEAINHNVIGGICIGTDLTNSKTALKLAQKYPNMFVAIGIHPEEFTNQIKNLWEGESFSQQALENIVEKQSHEFKDLLDYGLKQSNKKLIAIGEIGLDFYRLKTKGIKREMSQFLQEQIFTKQLNYAFQNGLPVILHVRDQKDRNENSAYSEVYRIVSTLITDFKTKKHDIPPIILHCVSGPKEYISNFLELGAYLGFAGNITYDTAQDLRDIFTYVPKNRILLETDAPYLAPGNKKGETCEPFFITQTAKFLQDNFQVNLDIILGNTLTVFPQLKKVVE